MEKEFIITSTNNIEGGNVIKYFGVINNNVVLGTNLFSDIGASFIDIFGGTSNSYQNKLKNIYETSIQNLKIKARNLGANAILGLSIDFDEISGGNKSMFMISVSGTAVSIEYSFNKIENNNSKINNSISNEILVNELNKRQIINKIENNKLLNQEEWYFLQQNNIPSLTEKLLEKYLYTFDNSISIDSEQGQIFSRGITNYFRVLDKDTSINILYDKLIKNPKSVFELINNNNLFSPEKVLWLIEKGEFGVAILCLNINKENYSNTDLSQMSEIIKSFESLVNRGNIKATKSLLGKDKEKYICPNGHTNEIESEFCETLNCAQNIKGLTKGQVEKIDTFKNKVETLSYLFNQN
ncbi:MAG: YbjQ family protein [Lutibacter sp.]